MSEAAVRDTSVLRRTLASLRSRNFRLFFIGQAISNSGNWLTKVALTLLIFHRTGSGAALGLLAACQFGPVLLLSAPAGAIADRHSKRKLLVASQSLQMGQSIALAVLAFVGTVPVSSYYAVALIGGCIFAFDSPIRRSFVNEMVDEGDVPNAVTMYSAMAYLAAAVGPALAGVLVISVGFGWCFTADAISYIAVLICLAKMRSDELRRLGQSAPRSHGQIWAGMRYIGQVPALWLSFVITFIVGVLTLNFVVVFPLFVEKGLGGSDGQYTVFYSVFSGGAVLGALAIAAIKRVTVRMIVLSTGILGIALLLLSAVPQIGLAIAVAGVVGVASVGYMTTTMSLVQVRSDSTMLGRVLAMQTMLIVGTTPIGGPLMGLIADRYGPRAPVVVGGVGALIAAAFGVFVIRRFERNRRRRTAREVHTGLQSAAA